MFRKLYASQEYKPHLVITGGNSFNTSRIGASAEKIAHRIETFVNTIPAEEKMRIIAENKAEHTQQQAEYVYHMLQESRIKQPFVVVVSAHHLPRLCSTFIKEIMKREQNDLQTELYTSPVYKDWKGTIPREPDRVRKEQILPEMERVHTYRTNRKKGDDGDVATLNEVKKYVDWLRNLHQPS